MDSKNTKINTFLETQTCTWRIIAIITTIINEGESDLRLPPGCKSDAFNIITIITTTIITVTTTLTITLAITGGDTTGY